MAFPLGRGSIPLLPLSLLLVIHTLVWCVQCSSFPNATTCIRAERETLLQFKQGLVDNSGLLSSWVGEDCRSWKGVRWSKRTGHVVMLDLRSPCVVMTKPTYYNPFDPLVSHGNCSLTGELHPSLMELKHLEYLDLSWNNFSYPGIPSSLGSLSELVYLNLSNALFSGKIPLQLGNLSNLQYLDLNNHNVLEYHLLTMENLEWVSGIPSLKHLDLSGISVVNADGWFRSVAALPSLLHLGLSGCSLPSIDPTLPVNFTSLEFLNLRDNTLGPAIPQWLLNMSSITHLDLSSSFELGSFSFPAEIVDNNKQLAFLDLCGTSLRGELPKNLSNLPHLFALSLSGNNLTGDISLELRTLSSGFHNKLRYLDLSENKLSGHLGDDIGEFKSLEYIHLSENSIEGPIPNSLFQLPSLKNLHLSGNKLTGVIPENIGHTSSLVLLDLSRNSLTSDIPGSIGRMLNLVMLDLSSNNLTGNIPESVGQMPDLQQLHLWGNKLTGVIPENIGKMSSLVWLGLSENLLRGGIPRSIGQLSNLRRLDLSSNHLSGAVTGLHFANLTSLTELAISSNYELAVEISNTWVPPFQLEYIFMSNCKVGPQFPTWLQSQRNIVQLDLSNGSISGVIPDWLYNTSSSIEDLSLSDNELIGQIPISTCKMKSLTTLGLSNNQLSGRLPHCWWKSLSGLAEITLRNNQLTGQLLTSICTLEDLSFLGMHNNHFYGNLPKCLTSMTSLEVLDLGRNKFSGRIPPMIGNLRRLSVLSLDFNFLSGEIPSNICRLANLQVLNLAHNNLSGSVPLCLDNLTAMTDQSFSRHLGYEFGVEVRTKSLTQGYTSVLMYLFSIDLSNNNLIGQIPEGLTQLCNLKNLNLSQNQLVGRIPSELADLRNLESLDLSLNRFSGLVPPRLSKLNGLSLLNLSYNQLSGPIPSGPQLITFTNDSYLGNNALCGPPLSRTCWGDNEKPDIHKQQGEDTGGKDESGTTWFYAGIAPGFTMGFVGVCGSLYFKRSWRQSFFLWSDHIFTQLLVILEISLARLLELFRKCREKSTW